jgi:radical SAM peptide maturase (CXXX-repeat target family)
VGKFRYPKKIEEYQNVIKHVYDTQDKCMNVTFQVTDACNLRCTYCYEINKAQNVMSLDTAKKFIDLLLTGEKGAKEYLKCGDESSVILEFIGGEPFLEIGLIEDIVKYFIKRTIELDHPWGKKFRLSMTTNGTLYFEPEVQAFLKRYEEVLSLTITVDGFKKLHDACRKFPDGRGSYDIVEKAVKTELARVPEGTLGTKITLSPDNIGYLYEGFLNMYNLGFKEIWANCVYEKGWAKEHANILYHEIKKISDYIIDNDLEGDVLFKMLDEDIGIPMKETDNDNWCGGNAQMICCAPDGKIYPCLRFTPSSIRREQYSIGDVDTGIGQCASCKDRITCLQCITRRSQSSDECFYCPIAKGCGWCTALNYDEGDANKRTTYTCEMHKARVLGTRYYWNKCHKKHGEKVIPLIFPSEWAEGILTEEEFNEVLALSDTKKRTFAEIKEIFEKQDVYHKGV